VNDAGVGMVIEMVLRNGPVLNHVENGIQGERRQLRCPRDESRSLQCDTSERRAATSLFNFHEDIQEMKIAKGIDDKAA
jgi:hypothetical protein